MVRGLASRHRVSQASPFVLSLGTATGLRAEATELGLRHQPEPPYRVLSTPSLSYGALRRLRGRLPELLGAPPHPFFDFERPHYGLNLFEPELALDSGPQPTVRGWPDPGEAGEQGSELVDALHLRCDGSPCSLAAEDVLAPVVVRLKQLATVWLQVARPEACADHLAAALELLSTPNPYLVCDLVLETPRSFDLAVMDQLVNAVQHRIHNLDWECYLAGPDPEPGHARVATRPLVLVPLGAVEGAWAEQAAVRYPLVHVMRVEREGDVKVGFALLGRLPGEGVLLEFGPGADARTVQLGCAGLVGLDRRVRACRNLAVKALLALEEARRCGRPRPRIPCRDRVLAFLQPGGGWSYRRLEQRRTLIDLTQLSWSLAGRRSQSSGA
jgi:hypothetical protein